MAESSGVGSISHILKTSFKDVYDEDKRRAEAAAERQRRQQKRLETPQEEDGGDIIPSEADDVDDTYYSAFEKMELYDKHKDMVIEKTKAIEGLLETQAEDGTQLASYISSQRVHAIAEEEEEEDNLKRQGIILGQHIPSLPTKLHVDRNYIEQFGNFSNNLVVARELVNQNQENSLRRTGNLPISELAEQRRQERGKRSSQETADVPHYYQRTHAAQLRENRVMERFAATISAREYEKAEKLASSSLNGGLEQRKKFPKRRNMLTAEQRLMNEEILKGINHKLNYLRNPRNNPNALVKMLVKNVATVEAAAANPSVVSASVSEVLPSKSGSNILGDPSISEASHTSAKSGASSSEKSKKSGKSIGNAPPLVNNPLFQTVIQNPGDKGGVPENAKFVSFTDYEVGQSYTATVSFRNVSAVTRSLRVIPPSTSFFSMSDLKFPKNSKAGMVAPGMVAVAHITFYPDSLGDYKDSLQVETESGSYSVQFKAARETPLLSLPPVIDLGTVLVGDASRVAIVCTNSGGKGKFRLLKPEHYPDVPTDIDWSTAGCTRFPPFTVYPVEFSLDRGESVDINIEYVPTTLGTHVQDFLLLSDSCQIKRYTIRAKSRSIDVSLVEINGIPIDVTDERVAKEDIYFSAANVGSEQSQQVVIANDTGMPIEYEWVWISDTKVKDLSKAGRAKIAMREKHEREEIQQGHDIRQLSAPGNTTPMTGTQPGGGGFHGDHSILPPPPSPSVQYRRGLSREQTEALERAFTPPKNLADITDKAVFNDTFIMSMGRDTPSATPGNSVKEKEFKIAPARGTLPPEGTQSFNVTFLPTDIPFTSCKAVLMLKNVTLESVPDTKNQSNYLAALSVHGHGKFHRLNSWLKAISRPADTMPHKQSAKDKDKDSLAPVINLHTALEMAVNHASSQHEESVYPHILAFHKKIRSTVKHVLAWRNDELVIEGDESTIGLGPGKGQLNVAVYDWSGDSSSVPEPVPHLILNQDGSKVVRPSSPNEQTGGVTTDEGNNNSNNNNNNNNNNDNDNDPSESNAPNQLEEEEEPIELTEEEADILYETWMEITAVMSLFGDEICHTLNELVKHEAIEFIQEKAHTQVACLSATVSGQGKMQILQVDPPLLEVSGKLPMGKRWTGNFTLTNTSNAMAEIEFCPEMLKVKNLDLSELSLMLAAAGDLSRPSTAMHASSSSSISPLQAVYLDPNNAIVQFEPPRILMMPETDATIDVSVSVNIPGNFEITVPLRSANVFAKVDSVVLRCSISGPRLRFNSPEVDVGLVGVGSSGQTKLKFTNESEVPARYSFGATLDLDPDVKLLISGSPRDNPGGNVANSGDGGGAGGDGDKSIALRTQDSFAISNPTSVILFDPTSDIIQPGETVEVTITCKAGRFPERVRGTIECSVFDLTGSIQHPSQFIGIRGEVQAPKTIMYPMQINLDKVYVDMPVNFQVTIENMCNLPTMFKFERPGGNANNYKIEFDQPSGPLGPKEKIVVNAVFTGLSPSVVDDAIANKIFGVSKPLGFFIKAAIKGVQLDFSVLPEGAPVPAPLAKPSDTRYPGPGPVPEPAPIEPIEFGSNVTLYERRQQTLIIRNLSAIPAPFKLNVSRYIVPDVVDAEGKDDANTQSKSRNSSRNNEMVLVPHEDGINKFHSKAGKAYVGARVQRQEDRKYLTLCLGAAYSIEPKAGVVEPWGVRVVKINTYNDMPGCYNDELVCTVAEKQSSRRFFLPVKLNVHGCPLLIEKDVIGMSVVKKGRPEEEIGQQVLHMGHACVNCDPLVREFRVRNNGSKNARVKWRVQTRGSKAKGLMDLKLHVSQDSNDKLSESTSPQKGGSAKEKVRVKVGLRFWGDINSHLAFKVEPDMAVIPSYGLTTFKVTLYRTIYVGCEQALLSASVDLTMDDTHSSSDGSSEVKPSQGGGGAAYNLLLNVEGHFTHPSIRLDKNVFEAVDNPTIIDEQRGIKLKTQAPRLFAKNSKPSDVCSKPVTLVNPLDASLLFSVSTEGPFILKNPTDDGTATIVASKQYAGDLQPTKSSVTLPAASSATLTASATTSTIATVSSLGRMYNLTPRESASFTVAFAPKRDVREKLFNSGGSDKSVEENGKLVLTFSTGQSIHLPLKAVVETPFISASTPRMYFGVCRTGAFCEGTLLLSNPTYVSATWTITHVPGAGSGRRESAIRVQGYQPPDAETDDPSVFEISPDAGVLLGPTVSVTAAIAAPPKDYNRLDGTGTVGGGGMADIVVPQRLMEYSWSSQTLTIKDSLQKRHSDQHKTEADAFYPVPITVIFRPKKNLLYSSRFRVSCEFGNSYDIVLHGGGTYNENEHAPQNPIPKPEYNKK